MSAELATLAADPGRIDSLNPDTLPGLIGEAEALKARLWARLQTAAFPGPVAAPSKAGPDRLLTVVEAAERLGVSKRWIYRRVDSLPFAKRLSEGSLRFSERGLEKWKQSRS
jgi:excisionase family DNA binding protein